MRRCYLILILIGFVSCKNDGFVQAKHIPSKIDSLDSEFAIQEYLHQVDSNLATFVLKPLTDYKRGDHYLKKDSIIRSIAFKNKIDKTYYKADFDNNGLTDLLLIGDLDHCNTGMTCQAESFVLMNFGKDSLVINPLEKGHVSYYPVIPKLVVKDGAASINLYNIAKDSATVISLHYRYGGFVEVGNPAYHKIEKIQFAAGPCFGSCPIFQMGIEKNGSATFLAEHFNFKDAFIGDADEGFYTTTINKKDLDNIISLLNYINFESLQNDYSVTWTDDRDGKLIITYDGGKTKTIHDYGLSGSYGLRLLYKHLHDLRFNQHWEKATEPKGIRIDTF